MKEPVLGLGAFDPVVGPKVSWHALPFGAKTALPFAKNEADARGEIELLRQFRSRRESDEVVYDPDDKCWYWVQTRAVVVSDPLTT